MIMKAVVSGGQVGWGRRNAMSIFISHVEENRDVAEAISRGLDAAGFAAWTYENSSVPGPTYLSQVMDAIERASAIVLVISPEALGSHQVAREIEAAHELDRPIIPVLVGISHEKYLQRRPEWRLALGAFTSIEVPREGVAAIMPKLLGGLEALGVARGEAASPPEPRAAPGPSRSARAVIWRRPWFVGVAGAALISLVAVGAILLLGGRDDTDGPVATPTTTTPTGSSVMPTDIPDVTQPLGQVKATLRVLPVEIVSTDTLTMTYTLTNTSTYDFTVSGTSITILLGASPGGTGVQLSDISQDLAAGATATGTVYASLADVLARPGRQVVWIDIGQRFSGGSVGDIYPARVPITIER